VLAGWNVPFSVQEFSLRYHFFFLVGLTILLLSILFVFLVIKRKVLWAFLTLLAVVAVLLLETEFSVPVVSSLLQKPTENIIINFNVPDAARELIFAAHYDSKTDVWDHIQRGYIQMMFPLFLIINFLLCLWIVMEKRFEVLKKKVFKIGVWSLCAVYLVYAGFAFSWLGGYTLMSDKSSCPGAIDDGAAVVALMGLAKNIKDGKVDTGNSNITILLTSGEEIGLQGAGAYVKERYGGGTAKPEIPTSLINIELAGQNGNMIYWKKVAGLLTAYKADEELIGRMNKAWKDISGREMDAERVLGDDTLKFGAAGIPFVTVGHSGIPGRGLGGFHSIHDNMDRVNPENLKLMVKTLGRYIESY